MTTHRLRLATVWLAGCSGCHMSFLDLDEWLFELVRRVDVVYSPLADIKVYPDNVDVALVEGAVGNESNLEVIKLVRARSKLLVSFGDCAVTGNVSALRNALGEGNADVVLRSAYGSELNAGNIDPFFLPVLLPKVLPVHAVVRVDHFLPGCPPPAAQIRAILEQLLNGAQ